MKKNILNKAIIASLMSLSLISLNTFGQQKDGFTVDVLWKNNSTIGIGIEGLNSDILQVINSDFARSGKLSIQNNAPYQLKSQMQQQGANYTVALNLYKDNTNLGGLRINSSSTAAIGHKISDFIYEMVLKKKGAFSTRLSYVIEKQKSFMLMISDSDGKNANVALNSQEPIISISWSPSGKDVAYVSFENKKPVVYIHNLASGTRKVLANYAGNNSAPSWSPNGKHLAIALSLNGNTQIYRINADGSNLVRLTNSRGSVIDTEPQYAPDSQSIYFTSDRGGEPQIYKMSSNGESNGVQRVTFKGANNTSPRISPDGENLAFISKGNGYQIHIQNLKTNNVYNISNTNNDESPSFAANGDYIIYSTKVNGKQTLVASPVEGGGSYVLSLPYAKVKQPTWGPFMQ